MNAHDRATIIVAQRLTDLVNLLHIIEALPPDLPGRWTLPEDRAALVVWVEGAAEVEAWHRAIEIMRNEGLCIREEEPFNIEGHIVAGFALGEARLQLVIPAPDPWVIYVETLDMEGLQS